MNTDRQRLLTINFGGIGDEILFLPALQSIRDEHPDWHITLMVEPRSRSIEQVTDLIDEIVTFDIKKRPLLIRDLLDLCCLIRDGSFDRVLSSGSSLAVSSLLFISGVKDRIGYGETLLSRFLLTSPVPLKRNQYAANMYHDLIRGLKIEKPAGLPRIMLKPASLEYARSLIHNQSQSVAGYDGFQPGEPGTFSRRILLHPGCSRLSVQKGMVKTWSPRAWARLTHLLCRRPDVQTILAGGPDDVEIVSEILQELSRINHEFTPESRTSEANAGSSPKVQNFISVSGRCRSLADLAALIDRCDLLVCVDSAPMHLAVALDKSLIALFGPTDEAKLLPPKAKFKAIRSPSDRGCTPATPSTGLNIQPDIVLESIWEELEKCSSTRTETHA